MRTPIGEERIAAFGTTRLHFRVFGMPGDLPDIVLDHGGGGSADDWNALVPLLAPQTRVFSYDRAGMGDSPADGQGCGAPTVSRRLAQLVEHAAVRRPFILVGYSLGGLYARHYAQQRPQDIAGLVLVDTTPTANEIPTAQIRSVMRLLTLFHWLARSGLGSLYLRVKGKYDDKARRAIARFAAPAFVPNMGAEMAAIAGVQAEVERVAAQLRHPTLAVLAGVRPPRMSEAEFAKVRPMHDALARSAPAPLSRQVVVETAHHGNLVNDPLHAAQLADHILAFARSLKSAVPA
ncbi:MAG TPA: alpha/beta hydrolase [Fontimonas sp.]